MKSAAHRVQAEAFPGGEKAHHRSVGEAFELARNLIQLRVGPADVDQPLRVGLRGGMLGGLPRHIINMFLVQKLSFFSMNSISFSTDPSFFSIKSMILWYRSSPGGPIAWRGRCSAAPRSCLQSEREVYQSPAGMRDLSIAGMSYPCPWVTPAVRACPPATTTNPSKAINREFKINRGIPDPPADKAVLLTASAAAA